MILGLPIFATIFAFALVVFIHELGHYLVGRFCGIGVLAFSVGFGPKLFSFHDRNNTEWKLCIIPLGGYVKFLTDVDKNKFNIRKLEKFDRRKLKNKEFKTFESSSLINKSLTVLAGPIANFFLAIIIFSCLSNFVGVTSNDPIIGAVTKVPSQKEYFKPGDRVVRVENQLIKSFDQIFEVAKSQSNYESVNFVIVRDSKTLSFTLPYIFQPIVLGVEMFSPAMKAGIKEGDVFLEANEIVLYSFSDQVRNENTIGSFSGCPMWTEKSGGIWGGYKNLSEEDRKKLMALEGEDRMNKAVEFFKRDYLSGRIE